MYVVCIRPTFLTICQCLNTISSGKLKHMEASQQYYISSGKKSNNLKTSKLKTLKSLYHDPTVTTKLKTVKNIYTESTDLIPNNLVKFEEHW